MSQYAKKENESPSLSSADIAIIIMLLQDCKTDLGPFPFTKITQLSKTITKLIKLREIMDNV